MSRMPLERNRPNSTMPLQLQESNLEYNAQSVCERG